MVLAWPGPLRFPGLPGKSAVYSDTALLSQFETMMYTADMLDWYSGLIGYDAGSLKLGSLYEVSPDGEVLYSTERWVKAKGSYDASIQVKRRLSTEEMRSATERDRLLCSAMVLEISGNPVKFLQGHNIFGPSVSSLAPVVQTLARKLPVDLGLCDVDSALWPAVHRTRVDTTVMVNLGNHQNVHDWLRHAATETRSRHGLPDVEQRGLRAGDTVYWGKHSRRWTMKAYCKFCELDAHRCPDMVLHEKLKEFVEGQLRLELTLRTPELKNRGTLDEGIVWQYFERVGVGVMRADEDVRRPNLKPAVENVLTLWLANVDVRTRLPKATFYRYRSLILEEVGVDISLPRQTQDKPIDRVKFDLAYLKAHEVRDVPYHLQEYLFQPGPSPIWRGRC